MDLPKRKPTRLKGYNYSTPGMYFLTVCVKDRKHLLGKIVGCGDFDAPQMILSEYGAILNKYINLMNNKYSHIKIDKYVIMPNHFHLILNIMDYKNGAVNFTLRLLSFRVHLIKGVFFMFFLLLLFAILPPQAVLPTVFLLPARL